MSGKAIFLVSLVILFVVLEQTTMVDAGSIYIIYVTTKAVTLV